MRVNWNESYNKHDFVKAASDKKRHLKRIGILTCTWFHCTRSIVWYWNAPIPIRKQLVLFSRQAHAHILMRYDLTKYWSTMIRVTALHGQMGSHYLNQCWTSYITLYIVFRGQSVNTLRARQNGRHFANGIFKCIFLNENFWSLNKISVKYVAWGLIKDMTALLQIMAWCRISDKHLSKAILICFNDAYMRHLASMS